MVTNAMAALKKEEGVECMVAPYGGGTCELFLSTPLVAYLGFGPYPVGLEYVVEPLLLPP